MTTTLLFYLAAALPSVNIGTLPWTNLPAIPIRAGHLDGTDGRRGLLAILKKKQCNLPNVTPENFNNLEIWYAMQIAPDGQVMRIVVEPKNCRPLESLVGAMAIQLVKTKRINAPSGSQIEWFASRIRFKN